MPSGPHPRPCAMALPPAAAASTMAAKADRARRRVVLVAGMIDLP